MSNEATFVPFEKIVGPKWANARPGDGEDYQRDIGTFTCCIVGWAHCLQEFKVPPGVRNDPYHCQACYAYSIVFDDLYSDCKVEEEWLAFKKEEYKETIKKCIGKTYDEVKQMFTQHMNEAHQDIVKAKQ